jgi:hypothetical protein
MSQLFEEGPTPTSDRLMDIKSSSMFWRPALREMERRCRAAEALLAGTWWA